MGGARWPVRVSQAHIINEFALLAREAFGLLLDAGQDDAITGAWEKHGATLEGFYDKSKAW